MNNVLNFKSFVKFLSKNQSYTLIDVFGLSISLMFVIIIAVYTKQEVSTDKFHEKKERIYALSDGEDFSTAFRLAYRMQERYPEIEKVCPIMSNLVGIVTSIHNQRVDANYLLVDTTFFDLFSFELLSGDRRTVLESRDYAVISETFAQKAFPGTDPLGQSIKVNDSIVVIVNGVMKDIKNSTIPYADILFRIDNVKYFSKAKDSERFTDAGSAVIFILEREGADIHSKEESMAGFFKEIFWIYRQGISEKVLFVPLEDIYFSSYETDGYLLKGDWRFVMVLFSVGIVILIFAIINYINLTVAQTGFRAKEMATRRLLGSSRTELFFHLMLESTLLTLFSFAVGILLVAFSLPFANDLLETKIDLLGAIDLQTVLLSVFIIGGIGVIAGLLPAIIISNARPVEVVKGSFRQKTKMVFSKFFMIFQNIITIGMVSASLIMVLQINYMIHAPLGYNTENIIWIDTEGIDDLEEARLLKNELMRLPMVKQVGLGQSTPFTEGINTTVVYEGRNISFQILTGDKTYFDIFDFKILQDNQLGNPEGYYLTEESYRVLGIPDEQLYIRTDEGWEFSIAGKIRNFHLYNITQGLQPVLLQLVEPKDVNWWEMIVQIEGDPKDAYERVKEIYEKTLGIDFRGAYMDQGIEASFAYQRRTSTIVVLFSLVALILSLLGLLAMSTYFIQQRSREVAVRKVFGSTNKEILIKLIRTFLNYVGIAFIIATPIIWYIMKRWISDYSYRISLSPWLFIGAGLFCWLTSFITVYWQSRKAAHANPVKSIKVE